MGIKIFHGWKISHLILGVRHLGRKMAKLLGVRLQLDFLLLHPFGTVEYVWATPEMCQDGHQPGYPKFQPVERVVSCILCQHCLPGRAHEGESSWWSEECLEVPSVLVPPPGLEAVLSPPPGLEDSWERELLCTIPRAVHPLNDCDFLWTFLGLISL